MTRTLIAFAGAMLLTTLGGCGEGGGEGESTLRETPVEKAPAPGSQLGSPDESAEGEE